MPKVTKADAEAPKWTRSSWSRVLELQPRLQELWDSKENFSQKRLIEELVIALNSNSSPASNEARKLVDSWCQMAYKDVDPMPLGSQKPQKPTSQQKYSTFFQVHRELLKLALSRADTRLETGRREVKLSKLKNSNLVYKQFMVVPDTAAKPAREMPEPETNSKIKPNNPTSAASLPQINEAQPTPNQTGVLVDFNEAVLVPEPAAPVARDTQDEVETMALDNSHLNLDDEEPHVSSSSIPLLMDESSVNSGPSEIITPATASSQLPDTSNQPPKLTRRGGRGTGSRKHWNDKKIVGVIQDDKSEAVTIRDGTTDVQPVVEQLPEIKKKKSTKSSKKGKQEGQSLQPRRQSVRLGIKSSKLDPPQIGHLDSYEERPAHESNPALLDKSENVLQLDMGPEASSERTSKAEPSPNLEDVLQANSPILFDINPLQAPPKSPRWPLQCPPAQPSQHLNLIIPDAKSLDPSPPTSVVSRTGELPHFPCLGPSSASLSETMTNQSSVTSSMECCNDSALTAKPGSIGVSLPAETDVRIPVWAVSRQELCELPYFKSMQGGVYSRAHTVYGYLLGRFPSPRDAWCHDGRLIISHGGGKNMMNEDQIQPDDLEPSTQSKHQLGDDQLETDASIRGLLRSYRMFRPVVLIAEADYEHLQKFNLKRGVAKEANYYVLGHYAIVAAWAEKEETASQSECPPYTRWKFAFQWIEQSQGPPWWLQTSTVPFPSLKPTPQIELYETTNPRQTFDRKVELRELGSHEIVLNPYPSQGKESHCQVCFTISPKVYQVQWTCLNPDCEYFWIFDNKASPHGELAFDQDFLSLRDLPKQIQEIPYSVIPEYPAWESQANQSIFNRHFWAGVCCHKCGRMSCRQKWQVWECPTCGEHKQESRPRIYSVSTLDDPLSWEHYGNGRFNPTELVVISRVVEYPNNEHRMVVYYQLPRDHGRIVHVLNNSRVSQTSNDLFEQYQKDACERDMFQRHAIKTHGVKGELYAQHFSFNAGVPYKYIAEAVSTPFDKCPESINNAVNHIRELSQGALGKQVEFNELLSVAYAEGQEMNFHSDDEPGLGPVVAGLTLGSSAEMIFRPNVSIKKNLIYKNGPYRASESFSINADNERILHITLSHGDLLIMDGDKIQKNYEHAVFVRDSDLVRFAATARAIDPKRDPSVHSSGATSLANRTPTPPYLGYHSQLPLPHLP